MSSQVTIDRMLSSVLEGLSDPAILVEPNRRILASNRAFRSRFNGGRDVRGALCFELTHGRSSPCPREEVGRCPLESMGDERVLHRHSRCLGEVYEEVFVHPVENPSGHVAAHLLVSHPLGCTVQLVGRSREFCQMMVALGEAARNSAPVLIWGEEGSGKMCVAQALHESSGRKTRPFVAVDCDASDDLTLAERLFGMEARGSGGPSRPGLIDSAGRGTLMLREVGGLPVILARRLYRTIRSGTFKRVGGGRSLPAEVRWVLSGQRLRDFGWLESLPGVNRIEVPPLRNRNGDLELLVELMVSKFGEGRIGPVSREVLDLLTDYSFPGNVRQLEGMVERACLLAEGQELLPSHFPDLLGQVH